MLAVMLFILMCMLCACAEESSISLGTAGEGGNYDLFGKEFAKILSKKPYNINIQVKTTAGSAANIRLLSKKYLELALAQSDIIHEMYYESQEDDVTDDYSAVAALYPEPVQIIVRADSKISSVADFAGKTVSVGEEGSGIQRNAEQILQAYGFTSNMLTTENMTYAEASDALIEGKIDAMFCTAGVPTRTVQDLSDKIPVRLLSIDDREKDLLTMAHGFYSDAVIPAGTYNGQDSDAATLAVQSVLVCSNRLSEDTVYKITKALFKERDDLSRAVPVEFNPAEKDSAGFVTIPFHPGAAKYYKECGIEVNTSGN